MTKDHRSLLRHRTWPVLLLSLMLGLSNTAYAQLETRLTALDAAAADAFGIAVDLDLGRAVIGAWRDDDAGVDAGSVYIFSVNRSRWAEEAELFASDSDAGDEFGLTVSIDGDHVIVGAPGDDDVGPGTGSAYIFGFDGTGWVEEAKLLPSDAAAADQFGNDVAISGDWAIVGAREKNDGEIASPGAAYLFHHDGTAWVEEAKLTASDAVERDRFGGAVSISGDRAIVGAYLTDDAGENSGAAYIFRFDGTNWVEEAKLIGDDTADDDRFGYDVGISGDRVIVGAHQDNEAGGDSGSAYLFRLNGSTWTQEDKITAADADEGDEFGRSVAINGERAIVGAPSNNDSGILTGVAYLFEFDGTAWVQEVKLGASDASAGNVFGFSVSIYGEQSIVGAFGTTDEGTATGSAYVYGPLPPVAVEDAAGVPTTYTLHGNYPNPFNPSTDIRFDLPQPTHARLSIFDVQGKEVARLFDEPLRAGTHTVTWEADGLPSGAYLYRLSAGAFSESKVMVLVR